ncbi:phosphotransferase enzyme family protein, partial [Deinococcus saxicola]
QWAALFRVAPGEPVPRGILTPENAASLGGFLAGLHLRLPEHVPFMVPEISLASIEQTVARLEQIEVVLLALPQPDEVDGWARERTRQRLKHLRTSALPDHMPVFSRRFLHGDYHDANVFFVDGQPAAIIDWEQTRLAPRAWEIVRALHLSMGLQPQLCTAFLAGYREVLSLPVAELEDGAKFYAALQERNVWTYESVYLENNPGPKVFIRPPPYVPFAQAWREAELR